MKATLIYQLGQKGGLPIQEVVTARSIYVRDGAVVIHGDDGEGNTYERGIPLARLVEYTITKTADDKPVPGTPPAHRQVVPPGGLDSTGKDPFAALRAARASTFRRASGGTWSPPPSGPAT